MILVKLAIRKQKDNNMKKLSSTVLCFILVLSMTIGSGNKLYSTEKADTKFVAIEKLDGTFESEYGAEITLILKGRSQLYVDGIVVTGAGNIGELDYVLYYYTDSNELVYENPSIGYKIVFKVIDENTLEAVETEGFHGRGASFSGKYKRI